jgi:4-amino-4-deoxy-L-arabinose transferase-like glycosyltransferase
MKTPDRVILAALVLVCLTPFLGKAFHVDDVLFVWTGQQIAHDPGNPFGYTLTWYSTPQPMFDVTKNPPLTSYYIAAVGASFGWSEAALHVAFLLPALAAILGTYSLAGKLTRFPLLAATATLVAPGFLVSSTSVMCDTTMVALWVLATLFWRNGLERKRPALLAVSGLLIAICALTKYFGIALIPLLLVYSVFRQRRVGVWMVYLLLPVAALAGYEYWTKTIYGNGLLGSAADYSLAVDSASLKKLSAGLLYKALAGLSFVGGCALPALTFAPVLWSRRFVCTAGAVAVLAGGCWGWVRTGGPAALLHYRESPYLRVTLALFIAGGVCALALAFSDWRRSRDADSMLLLLWVLGTFGFASFLNWGVNARSVLPMIPAVAILLARRVQAAGKLAGKLPLAKLAAALAVSGAVSLWVCCADTAQANSARMAAQYVRDRLSRPELTVSFEGHWGFQYYMQAFGFSPVDFWEFSVKKNGDLLVIPDNNSNASVQAVSSRLVASRETFAFPINTGATTIGIVSGAGFYSDLWGPLPYAFGPAPPERYTVLRLQKPEEKRPSQAMSIR